MGHLIEDLGVSLEDRPMLPGVGAVRGETQLPASKMANEGESGLGFTDSGQVSSVLVVVDGREIKIGVAATGKLWTVSISVVDIPRLRSVAIERDDEQIDCIEMNGRWCPVTGELESGHYTVLLKDDHETLTLPMELEGL